MNRETCGGKGCGDAQVWKMNVWSRCVKKVMESKVIGKLVSVISIVEQLCMKR